MQKLLTGFAAASTFVLFASAAQAQCSGTHNVTASTDVTEQSVAMSTYDGPLVPPVAAEEEKVEKAAVICAESEKDCAAGTNSAASR